MSCWIQPDIPFASSKTISQSHLVKPNQAKQSLSLLESPVLNAINGTLQVGCKIGLACVVPADHVDQVVIHDRTIEAHIVECLEHADQVVITCVRESLVESDRKSVV